MRGVLATEEEIVVQLLFVSLLFDGLRWHRRTLLTQVSYLFRILEGPHLLLLGCFSEVRNLEDLQRHRAILVSLKEG